MKNKCYILLLYLILCPISNAQKSLRPKWINQQTIIADKCDFILVHLDGESNIQQARTAAAGDLRLQIEHTDNVSVEQIYSSNSHDAFSSENGAVRQTTHQEDDGWLEIKVEGVTTPITSRRIGEYWNPRNKGNEYYALFAIQQKGSNVNLSCLTETSKYENLWETWALSLVPGAAQMYKGSYVKGGIIMGGSVALVGGIIAFENMRADNMSKISQTHSADIKKTYNNNANNAALGRNICIGGLAALYVYNIVDAFVAPGARRIIVTPSATADGQYGLSASLSF